MDSKIAARAKYWAESPVFDAQTNAEIQSLLTAGDERQLTDKFYRDLEFGTGGMRGVMGAGTAMMNIYNIRKASLALADYLLESNPRDKPVTIAISYDSRLRGREFAEAACEVFAARGIRSLITKAMRPVPMLSFMVRHFGCQAGVCVTASHNPPEYNGYKVYWSTGGQLVPPHDGNIVARYGAIQDYGTIPRHDFRKAKEAGLIDEISDELDQAYFAAVAKLSLRPEGRKDFKIVYSPLHGTGIFAVPVALERFGFHNISIVPEQREPDGRFPTVKSPNPEDPAAMVMALALAKKERADIVLATDPDSDRIAVIAREGDDFIWFNGNQLGCLLIDYVLGAATEKGRLTGNDLVIKTIVTTELQRKIASSYGVDCIDTLTGFKWICDLIEEYESGAKKPYKKFICGGEESYGFLMDTFVRDKDAVIACAIASEMVAWNKSKGRTMTAALDALFSKHNVFHESLFTATFPGMEGANKIKKMMSELREKPPTTIAGLQVEAIEDYERGVRSEPRNSKFSVVKKLTLPRSDVLQFSLGGGTRASVRPSGTEPKIKFYVSVEEPAQGLTGKDLQNAKTSAMQRAKAIEEAFVELTK
jgi:phosphoglucomutase